MHGQTNHVSALNSVFIDWLRVVQHKEIPVVSAAATFSDQIWTSAMRLTFVSLWRGESP